MQNLKTYKPSYVWPNPAFPFRVYYQSDRLRIFIIENVHHNWNWLSTYAEKIRDTDFFFVLCGWYHSEAFAREAALIFSLLQLKKKQFFFLFNSANEEKNLTAYGFTGKLINQNAWLDYNVIMRPLPEVAKKYDAIYVARFSAFKRHHLAKKVNNIALVAGSNHGNPLAEDLPAYCYLNENPLSPEEVCIKINESICGLILSHIEGACYASSEYLLCGIPVVSTPSEGGRDVWYDDYNSIICNDTPEAVADAVSHFVADRRDPNAIRARYIEKSEYYRRLFITELEHIFARYNEQHVNAEAYFHDNFMHKMRRSYRPDFEQLFT